MSCGPSRTLKARRVLISAVRALRRICRATSRSAAMPGVDIKLTDPSTNVIDALRRHEDENGSICLPVRPRFATGDKVRLVDGAFVDCIGLFEGMKDIERISVLLDLLGRKVRVVLDADSVAAA